MRHVALSLTVLGLALGTSTPSPAQRPPGERSAPPTAAPADTGATELAARLVEQGMSVKQAAEAMRHAGHPPLDAARGLLAAGSTHVAVAGALRSLGYRWGSIAPWLVRLGLHPEEANLSIWLAAVDGAAEEAFSPSGVARALRDAGFAARPIAETLRNEEHSTLAESAGALRAARFPEIETARALFRAYAPGAPALAAALGRAGYDPAQIRNALVGALGLTEEEAAKLVTTISP